MKPPATNPSSPRQRGRSQTPPAGYIVTTTQGHQVLVRRPDGRPMRIRPSRPVLASGRVQSGQSYLNVPAA